VFSLPLPEALVQSVCEIELWKQKLLSEHVLQEPASKQACIWHDVSVVADDSKRKCIRHADSKVKCALN
jgi:hypothetical protein